VSTASHLSHRPAAGSRDVTLLELLDRLVDNGVVLHGDITLAVADIDLIYVGLRAIISSVSSLEERG
jgi:gas vesicle structural protein